MSEWKATVPVENECNSVIVCVCVPGIHHVMGTKCPHKDSNTSKFWPCVGFFFLVPMRKQAYKSQRMECIEIWNSRKISVSGRFRWRVGVGRYIQFVQYKKPLHLWRVPTIPHKRVCMCGCVCVLVYAILLGPNVPTRIVKSWHFLHFGDRPVVPRGGKKI